MKTLRQIAAAAKGPIPAQAGIGLRAQHHGQIMDERPPVAWLEAHSENYFADGGAQTEALAKARELYPLSLHGVGPVSYTHLDVYKRQHRHNPVFRPLPNCAATLRWPRGRDVYKRQA